VCIRNYLHISKFTKQKLVWIYNTDFFSKSVSSTIWNVCIDTYERRPFISANDDLLEGSYDQQAHIRLYREGGHPGGRGNLSPFSILPITSLFFTPWNGLIPYIRISHIHTPVRYNAGSKSTVNLNMKENIHSA
jgi:hypothetical protein